MIEKQQPEPEPESGPRPGSTPEPAGAPGSQEPAGDPFDQPAPTEPEKDAAWSVRHRAEGMAHHEVKAALAEAREAAEQDGADDLAVARAEEWERIADLMVDHAGRYEPDIDPFVQGELAGESNVAAAEAAAAAEEGGAEGADEAGPEETGSGAAGRR